MKTLFDLDPVVPARVDDRALSRERLTRRQIGLLLFIHRKGGNLIYLGRGLRPLAVTLWRRHIVKVWYRQDEENLVGPYFQLSVSGRKLAETLAARRRLPFAEAA